MSRICPGMGVGFARERGSATADGPRVPGRARARAVLVRAIPAAPRPNLTRNKSLTILGEIMERALRVYGLPSNLVRDIEKLRERYDATRFDFYSSEEVWALVRAAASEQDGAIFLTAAYTGLRRGELIALRWATSTSIDQPCEWPAATPTAS